MPLHYATEPQNGAELVRAGLNQLATRASYLSTRNIELGATELKPPHAIYDLRADEIARGAGLASARATGFRYMVEAPGGSIAAAEVQADASGKAALLATVNYGPYVVATTRALDDLAKLEQVGAGSFEVRLLRFSAIQLMAIWLKSDAGGADIVYPLAPAPTALKAETPYSVDDFLKAITPLAKVRAESADPKKTP